LAAAIASVHIQAVPLVLAPTQLPFGGVKEKADSDVKITENTATARIDLNRFMVPPH